MWRVFYVSSSQVCIIEALSHLLACVLTWLSLYWNRHTGVGVYGKEYFFGGGIQSVPLKQSPYGTPVQVAELGTTQVPQEIFEEYLREIQPRYTQDTYNLMKHNCNNFSDEVSQFLVGTGIPENILRLPEEILNSPMGPMLSKWHLKPHHNLGRILYLSKATHLNFSFCISFFEQELLTGVC